MFYAHSLEGQVEERWEPLATHLAEVAYEAAQRTEKFGCGDLGQLAGLLHDFGKYKAEFQERIRKQRHERVDHSSAGAVFALERLGPLGRLIAHPVAGHHAGLQDSLLAADGRLARRQQELNSALRGHRIAGDGTRLPTGPPRPPSVFKPGPEPGFSWAFLIRMLFSALVDADYICTERFYARAEGRDVDRGPGTDLDGLSDALHAHLKNRRRELEALGTTRSSINLLRNEVLETPSLRASSRSPGSRAPGANSPASMSFRIASAMRW